MHSWPRRRTFHLCNSILVQVTLCTVRVVVLCGLCPSVPFTGFIYLPFISLMGPWGPEWGSDISRLPSVSLTLTLSTSYFIPHIPQTQTLFPNFLIK
jgi:hypothetical protein